LLDKDAKIFVAGHRGLVGAAILRKLTKEGYSNLLVRSHAELDLARRELVDRFFETERPDYVFLAAAKVGGILANDRYPADFIVANLRIQTNVIDAAYRFGVRKLLFLGSSCIYPRCAPQPIKEESLLTGPLEPTNRAYALAKIAGIEMCRAYRRQYGFNAISLMPTNLYGPGDNFEPVTSHVLAALIRKCHEAKTNGGPVVVWGSGTPRREFLHVDDLADAALFLMRTYEEELHINVGTGRDCTVRELAQRVADLIAPDARLEFDPSKPDGTPRKLLDVSRIESLGWRARIALSDGIQDTYRWFLETHAAPVRTLR
jgi:GDP-L-fucose synthase